MVDRPNVNPFDWIKVEGTPCVVAVVRNPDHVKFSGDLEVVFDPKKPTNHDVEWNGQEWVFCKRGDFGGYADRYPRLSAFVNTLKAGRYAR